MVSSEWKCSSTASPAEYSGSGGCGGGGGLRSVLGEGSAAPPLRRAWSAARELRALRASLGVGAATPLQIPHPSLGSPHCMRCSHCHAKGLRPPLQTPHPILGSPCCMHCSHHHAQGLRPPFRPHIPSWDCPAACIAATAMHRGYSPPSAPTPHPGLTPLHAPHSPMCSWAAQIGRAHV